MTDLVYWTDTYIFEHKSKVSCITEVDGKTIVQLDSTIFYPQGGGQPGDVGTITVGDITFEVQDTKKVGDQVHHFGKFPGDTKFVVGDLAHSQIDEAKRRLNARLHSAGHLLDVVVKKLALDWVPGKGYHFPSGPYVEYSGNLPAEKRPPTLQDINKLLKELIAEGSAVTVEIVPYGQIGAVCGGEVPSYLPVDQPARIVTIGGIGCPCAGTHVKDISEIGPITVTKFTVKKNNIRVSYQLQ